MDTNIMDILTVFTIIAGISLVIIPIMVYLVRKQVKFVSSLKVGDKVRYENEVGTVIKKTDKGRVVVEMEVSGMKLSKYE